MPGKRLVSAGYGEKASVLTGKHSGAHTCRVLCTCKQMLLNSSPDSPCLDFALKKEKEVRILGLLTQVACELGLVCHGLYSVLVNENLGR